MSIFGQEELVTMLQLKKTDQNTKKENYEFLFTQMFSWKLNCYMAVENSPPTVSKT